MESRVQKTGEHNWMQLDIETEGGDTATHRMGMPEQFLWYHYGMLPR